ncbi:Mitochondrial intermediate peptidase, partial [Coemansia helicoidea]
LRLGPLACGRGRLPPRTRLAAHSRSQHSVARADDVHLRDLFDLPTTTTLGSTWFRHGQPTGLLMESRFVSPKTFRAAGKQAVAEAGKLAQWVLDAQTAEEKRAVVKCLDQLSDALCRVMDVAELVRQVHPDSSWQAAAEDVFSEMLEYMNELNTHVGLYAKLVDVMDDPEIAATLDPVEREVALSFRRDFERSGIHLPASTHARFVELSSSIHDYSREFLRCQSLPPAVGTVAIPVDKLRTLPSEVLVNILQSSSSRKRADGVAIVDVVPDDYTAQYILRDCPDERIREEVYRAWQSGAPSAVDRLERL